MREICLNTLERILELVQKHPEIESVSGLAKFLERSPDRIENLIDMLLSDTYKPDRQLRKYAQKRIAELRAASAGPSGFYC